LLAGNEIHKVRNSLIWNEAQMCVLKIVGTSL